MNWAVWRLHEAVWAFEAVLGSGLGTGQVSGLSSLAEGLIGVAYAY